MIRENFFYLIILDSLIGADGEQDLQVVPEIFYPLVISSSSKMFGIFFFKPKNPRFVY